MDDNLSEKPKLDKQPNLDILYICIFVYLYILDIWIFWNFEILEFWNFGIWNLGIWGFLNLGICGFGDLLKLLKLEEDHKGRLCSR